MNKLIYNHDTLLTSSCTDFVPNYSFRTKYNINYIPLRRIVISSVYLSFDIIIRRSEYLYSFTVSFKVIHNNKKHLFTVLMYVGIYVIEYMAHAEYSTPV